MINVVLNTFRTVVTSVLTMYAIYKPYDYDDNYDIFDTPDRSIPAFALTFFRLLEGNLLFRRLLFMRAVQNSEIAMLDLNDRRQGMEE